MVVESASLPDQGIELMRGEVIKQSRTFLDEYDSLLLHKELYRKLGSIGTHGANWDSSFNHVEAQYFDFSGWLRLEQTQANKMSLSALKTAVPIQTVVPIHPRLRYRSLFLYTLESVRDDVVKVLQRFISLPTEPFQHGVIECCGISFEGKKEYTNHYQHVHNLKAVQFMTLCEMKLALAKIAIFQRTIHGYLRAGNLSSCEMIYFLKQVLKKLNNTIDF